jgi:hypothetical protein
MDLFKLHFDDSWNLVLVVSPMVLIGLILAVIAFKVFRTRLLGKDYEIDEAEIGIGNSKITVRPNYEDMQIAYQLYVELTTRKIGLPIDVEDDFLIEVYNSWYEFFKVTRSHIKAIPAQKIRKSKTTRAIVKVAIEVLNEGLRPHLSKWQARFRKWYDINSAKEDFKHKNPQDLQKEFPDFDKLVKEMKSVNKKLIEYRKTMKRLAIGND